MRLSPALLTGLLLAAAPAAVFAQAQAPASAVPAATPQEEIGKIDGIEVARPGGGFLGIRTEGVVLKVTFYDDKKKPVPADAIRIAARWHDNKPRRTVLLPSGESTLVSPAVISRPFNYIMFLVLIGPDDKDIETHSLRLTGS